jgi:arylsulfate sulfotransferase
MNSKNRLILILTISTLFFGCRKDIDEIKDITITPAGHTDTLILNPYGNAPLSAINYYQTDQQCKVEVVVKSKTDGEPDFTKSFSNFEKAHQTPILGLYPDFLNTVYINYYNTSGDLVHQQTKTIQTEPLIDGMPEIIVRTAELSNMEPGFTLVSYWGSTNPHKPFIMDHYGNIRWYLDFSENAQLTTLNYANGIERLQNGNYYFGDLGTHSIYEVSPLGKVTNTWGLSNFEFHHNVQEKKDGNFLVTTSKPDSKHANGKFCVEDFVVEVNRNSGNISNVWDLKYSLDENRSALTPINNTDNEVDWFHGNAVIEDATDQTIIVSGRTQGVVKLDAQNKPVWILANHKDWDSSRNESNLEQYLLTPLDASGTPIIDTNILYGNQNHPDFIWPWYQHAPKLMPNGNLLVFDNGDNRNYEGTTNYSRVVEYEIDEANLTVKQIWSYGKNRGDETFAQYVSDVDYLPIKNNILFSPGFSTNNSGKLGGKVVEIDYSTKNVVFEVEINPAGGFIALHRAERLTLYP